MVNADWAMLKRVSQAKKPSIDSEAINSKAQWRVKNQVIIWIYAIDKQIMRSNCNPFKQNCPWLRRNSWTSERTLPLSKMTRHRSKPKSRNLSIILHKVDRKSISSTTLSRKDNDNLLTLWEFIRIKYPCSRHN